jgi:ATP adenylyltransferase
VSDPARAAHESLDTLQRLWTPWRMGYIRGEGKDLGGCPFCVLPGRGEEQDEASLILHRAETVYVILNAYPYNPGHLMVVPYRHVAGLDELTADEVGEMAAMVQQAVLALKATSNPDAFNVGMNIGTLAGAGIAEHLHQHVVPRWGGDTNFMPLIGQTRVLPELLEETYQRLAGGFQWR